MVSFTPPSKPPGPGIQSTTAASLLPSRPVRAQLGGDPLVELLIPRERRDAPGARELDERVRGAVQPPEAAGEVEVDLGVGGAAPGRRAQAVGDLLVVAALPVDPGQGDVVLIVEGLGAPGLGHQGERLLLASLA